MVATNDSAVSPNKSTRRWRGENFEIPPKAPNPPTRIEGPFQFYYQLSLKYFPHLHFSSNPTAPLFPSPLYSLPKNKPPQNPNPSSLLSQVSFCSLAFSFAVIFLCSFVFLFRILQYVYFFDFICALVEVRRHERRKIESWFEEVWQVSVFLCCVLFFSSISIHCFGLDSASLRLFYCV